MVICDGNLCTFSMICGKAQQVCLVGDFNNWSTTAHAMQSCGAGRWRAQVRLRPGTYRFAYFVINDRRYYLSDPTAGLTSVRPDVDGQTIYIPYPESRPSPSPRREATAPHALVP